MIKIKRIYERPSKEDGYRILVDRLWPRGLTKEKADIDIWLKEIAPSTDLRKWFAHDHKKWKSFEEKYKRELKNNADLLVRSNNWKKKKEILRCCILQKMKNTMMQLCLKVSFNNCSLKHNIKSLTT